MKYPNVTLGHVEAVWNKLGGEEGVGRFLRDELLVSERPRSWREEDGVIYFSVTSDGTTGEEWIKRLKGNGFHVEDCAKQVLRSSDFVPTNGVTTEVAVLRGCLFCNDDLTMEKIRTEGVVMLGGGRKLFAPDAEVACLIRELLTDKEIEAMGLWWVVAMHEPMSGSETLVPRLLYASRHGNGRLLGAAYAAPCSQWDHSRGFAFAVSSSGPGFQPFSPEF